MLCSTFFTYQIPSVNLAIPMSAGQQRMPDVEVSHGMSLLQQVQEAGFAWSNSLTQQASPLQENQLVSFCRSVHCSEAWDMLLTEFRLTFVTLTRCLVRVILTMMWGFWSTSKCQRLNKVNNYIYYFHVECLRKQASNRFPWTKYLCARLLCFCLLLACSN